MNPRGELAFREDLRPFMCDLWFASSTLQKMCECAFFLTSPILKPGMQVAYGKNSVTNKAVRTKFLSDRRASLEEKVFEDDHMVCSCGAWTSVGAFALTSGGSRANKGRGPYWHLLFYKCYRHCRRGSTPSWFHVWDSWVADKSPQVSIGLKFDQCFCIISGRIHASRRSQSTVYLDIPGVSFTQVAKTRLRLFSASKDALRIWSVKSATVSRKSQWRYFEALLHLSLDLGCSTISGWYFLWWRCIFKANIS